ncbi:MAG: HAD family hydrolase [Pseudomonadota bacterium]
MRHWIFDFDGTLVDTDGIFERSLVYALEPFSVDVGPNFMEQIRHKHPYRIFEDHLDEQQAQMALERIRERGQIESQKVQAFAGIKDVLSTLDSKKVSLSIWTGRDRVSTERILANTGLNTFFKEIISGTCVPTNKPGHDGLLEIKSRKEAQPDEMVMIGDHHHDIEPANALGVTSVHARWKRTPHVLPEKIKPNYEFGSTEDFYHWVLSQI